MEKGYPVSNIGNKPDLLFGGPVDGEVELLIRVLLTVTAGLGDRRPAIRAVIVRVVVDVDLGFLV